MTSWRWGRGNDDHPPPQPAKRIVALTMSPHGGRGTVTTDDQVVYRAVGHAGRMEFTIPFGLSGGADLLLEADGYKPFHAHVALDPELLPFPQNLVRSMLVRAGRVRASGRSFVDDTGPFFPLGGTLFWSPRGWKQGEQERVRQQWAFFKRHGYDFTRILGDVGWGGLEIDSTWPDYQDVMAGVIDAAYDEYGLRTQLTVWGGSARDPMRATEQLVEVIRGREHKILYLEGANERNLQDIDTLITVTKKLMTTGCLTAPGFGDDYGGVMQDLLQRGAGNMASVHLSRTEGDRDWRFVRQGWDVKGYPWPTSLGEGKGPLSSASSNSNPLQLAMSRAVGILCGAGCFILHNAAGVYGVPNRDRPANVWETPNIEAIMTAVRGIDPLLPVGVENWTRANDGWTAPPHPLRALDFWEGGHGTGVNKNYSASRDRAFVTAPCGVMGVGRFEARAACRVTVSDPLAPLTPVATKDLATGEILTLSGTANAQTAYLINGVRL